ncbi:MAG: SLC13 family permease [Pyrinomonadaceae bacterium]|nr:SLC13 family permease [Pyrinomonadaceae bacterium]
MTNEMLIVLVILIGAIVLFITEWVRIDLVALAVVVCLMLSGVISPSQALSGFSSSAVITIAALFVVGGGVLNTGLAGTVGRKILNIAGEGELRLIVVLMLAVALLSSVMSDTGTVAVLLPAVIYLARSSGISASKLLMPLAFGSLLGGAMTLIGTPPNIIVSDTLEQAGRESFVFFSYTPMGLILLAIGTCYMAFIGRKLIKDRAPDATVETAVTPGELIDTYRLSENLFRLRVRADSRLIGMTIAGSQWGRDHGVRILKIFRPKESRTGLARFRLRREITKQIEFEEIEPTPDSIIEIDDILLVEGDSSVVSEVALRWSLGLQPAKSDDEDSLLSDEAGVAEVILPPGSGLVGKTLTESRFSNTYGLTVLAIKRPGNKDVLDTKDTRFRFGDSLLVQGPWSKIMTLKDRRRDFVVTGQPAEYIASTRQSKAYVALAILVGMVVLIVTDVVPVTAATLSAALLMVLTGCLTMDEGYKAISWKSIILIAGMIPMAAALESVGLVDMAANSFVGTLGAYGPRAVLAGLFLLTAVFTQVLSNTATTVVIAPIGLAAADSLSVEPYAFMMAVAVAASMGFASPVASPVNTLVMGAGNYRFGDYARVGGIMIVISGIAAVIALPVIFPF